MALSVGSLLPSFDGATLWLNTEATNSGPVIQTTGPVLVHFWAMSCPACKINMPDLQALRDKYGPLGLQTIAVHTPRGETDKNAEAVAKMASDLGLTEPCAVDDTDTVADAFQMSKVWPLYFVFGPTGKLKVRAAGGFGVTMCKSALANVFGE